MLRFCDVAKHYADGTRALDGVSIEVPRGQFCVLLGPSGAGKSTLLRLVNGLATASSGQTSVDGVAVEPRHLKRLRPRVAMIHQQFNLVARASVETNVLCGALPSLPLWRAMTGVFPAALRRKACELMASVDLGEEHLDRRAGELSGGQQQRVGIARAFMLDPLVVLADEPVASLDPRTSRDVLSLLHRQSRARGCTVLCSLHQTDLAREFADRIVALRGGRVVFDGPPRAFDSAAASLLYASQDAASALAAPPRDEPVPAPQWLVASA
jgi:phosphonate transport system ATP-binding protein